MGDGLDTMKFYKEVSKVRNGASTKDVALTKSGEITVGKFVDRERSDYHELMHDKLLDSLGDDYMETEACSCQ
jgi:2-oxoglutarate ferredoxin oxidoreductase subunit beta